MPPALRQSTAVPGFDMSSETSVVSDSHLYSVFMPEMQPREFLTLKSHVDLGEERLRALNMVPPNPWRDLPPPKEPHLETTYKRTFYKSNTELPLDKWPYFRRLAQGREEQMENAHLAVDYFIHRGHGPPGSLKGYPGDLYIDITAKPLSFLYCSSGEFWRKYGNATKCELLTHPLTPTTFLAGSEEKGFRWLGPAAMKGSSLLVDPQAAFWEMKNASAMIEVGAKFVKESSRKSQRDSSKNEARPKAVSSIKRRRADGSQGDVDKNRQQKRQKRSNVPDPSFRMSVSAPRPVKRPTSTNIAVDPSRKSHAKPSMTGRAKTRATSSSEFPNVPTKSSGPPSMVSEAQTPHSQVRKGGKQLTPDPEVNNLLQNPSTVEADDLGSSQCKVEVSPRSPEVLNASDVQKHKEIEVIVIEDSDDELELEGQNLVIGADIANASSMSTATTHCNAEDSIDELEATRRILRSEREEHALLRNQLVDEVFKMVERREQENLELRHKLKVAEKDAEISSDERVKAQHSMKERENNFRNREAELSRQLTAALLEAAEVVGLRQKNQAFAQHTDKEKEDLKTRNKELEKLLLKSEREKSSIVEDFFSVKETLKSLEDSCEEIRSELAEKEQQLSESLQRQMAWEKWRKEGPGF